jgi:tRNA (guanine37-N1)-methyltransferase
MFGPPMSVGRYLDRINLMKRFDIITIFPDIFSGFLSESLIAKAQKKRLISIHTHYLRKWTTDRHQTVDGKPYGGGPGLVMKIEPIAKAVKALRRARGKRRVILFSPRGKQFTQKDAQRLVKYDQINFICGRYEGVDERVADYVADEVFSVGPYVLNGGEVPAMLVIESVARLIPGFMHDADSQNKEDHAQYTKPEVFMHGRKKLKVPPVLLSGNHAKIKEWRDKVR